MKNLLNYFEKERGALIFLIDLLKNDINKSSYLELENELELSRYKIKKFLKFLEKNDIINYREKGHTKDKEISINFYRGNKVIKYIKEDYEMKRKPLLPFLDKKKHDIELADKPVLMFPFKINGSSPKDLPDYSMQKYLQAKFGYISWDKITKRDLAGIFMMLAKNHKKIRLFEMRKINWAGTVIEETIMERDFVTKENYLVVIRKFIEIYERDYMSGCGLNWNYINEYHTHREKILDRIKKELYNKVEHIKDEDVIF